MSPVAAIVAAALAAAAAPAVPAAANAIVVPPIVVDVTTMISVSPAIVSNALDEAQAIYRSAGVRFSWQRGTRRLGALRVLISDEVGPPRTDTTPLGWVTFENGQPTREIHLSFVNLVRFMEQARETVGIVSQKTLAERYRLLGRALGRALAHELGHYLLATPIHSPKGLLKGSRSAQEFFGPDRSSFAMNLAEKREVAARVLREFDVARRHN